MMILCKVYKSGHRSDVMKTAPPRCASPASLSARKRKAGAVQHPDDEVPTRARQRQQKKATEEDEEAMLFAQRLESEMQQQQMSDDDAMVFAQILEGEMDLLREHEAEHAAPEQSPPADEDDDEVTEISLDEFLGCSASAPRAAAPPCTAHQQEIAAVSCLVQTSSQHDEQSTTDSDVIKIIPDEKLMSASSPLTDDDDDDTCGLACPPMDDDYVELMLSEPLVQFFDQALVGEFITDL